MKLTFCAAYGVLDDLQHRHLVTRDDGGRMPSQLKRLEAAA
jgi:hypothetical protein